MARHLWRNLLGISLALTVLWAVFVAPCMSTSSEGGHLPGDSRADRTPLSGCCVGSKISSIVGKIPTDEHRDPRPFLPCVLVNTSGNPVGVFFKLARSIGPLDSSDRDDELRSWEVEKRANNDVWQAILPKWARTGRGKLTPSEHEKAI